eukprot:scaffold119528_cov69-Phaeocystis_antarctica.AAC.1
MPLRVYVPFLMRLAYGTSIAPFQPTLACTAVALRWWSSRTSRRSPRGVRRRSASVLPPRAGTISTFSPVCVLRRTLSLTISSPEPKLSSSTANLAVVAYVARAHTVKTVSIVTSAARGRAGYVVARGHDDSCAQTGAKPSLVWEITTEP